MRQLTAAITLQSAKGVKGHPLWQITGWPQGIASYRWLDNAHLLLYPTIREELGSVVLPMVMNLNNGKTWMPATDGPDYLTGNVPLWSKSLKQLISSQGQEVLLYDLQGKIMQRFAGASPLYLSPSGRRLLDRFGWHDLVTGKALMFVGQDKWGLADPAWSLDETRLFGDCDWQGFAIADVVSNTYQCVIPNLFRDGEGPFPGFHWILSDTRILNEVGFSVRGYDHPTTIIPLIDPASRTYVDVRNLAGLPASWQCETAYLAPDTEHLWLDCRDQEFRYSDPVGYLMDLRTSLTLTMPAKWEFYTWSPDSRFAVMGQNVYSHDVSSDRSYQKGERWPDTYALFSVTSGDFYTVTPTAITAPIWDSQSKRLAFVTEDGMALVVLDVATHATASVPLSQPALDVRWKPQGNELVVIADNGSLWRIRDLTTGNMEQFTPSVPEIDNKVLDLFQIQWSPDGNRLAFISGHDVHVVSTSP